LHLHWKDQIYCERDIVQRKNIDIVPSDVVTELDDLSVTFRGKYWLVVTNDILESMKANDNINITWLCSKKNIKRNNNKLCLNKDLVRVLLRKIGDIGDTNCVGDIAVMGYTRATINMDNRSKIILYAHLCFQGNPRYAWAYIHFQEVSPDGIKVENYYPSRILGFITLQGITEAVIQCAEKPLLWLDNETIFSRVKIGMPFDVSFVTVPVLLWCTLYVYFLNLLRVRIRSLLYYHSKTGVVSLVTNLHTISLIK
jgi:hypothetical protein